MLNELQVLRIYFEDNRTNKAIDLAGDFSSVRFPMEMSGGKDAGNLQNTLILPITIVVTSRAISCMLGASSVSSYRDPMISCSTLARTFHLSYLL
jgi:hypothetical protein